MSKSKVPEAISASNPTDNHSLAPVFHEVGVGAAS